MTITKCPAPGHMTMITLSLSLDHIWTPATALAQDSWSILTEKCLDQAVMSLRNRSTRALEALLARTFETH